MDLAMGVGGHGLGTAMSRTTIATLLADGAAALRDAGIESPRLNAEVLLAHACGVERTALFAADRELMTEARARAYAELLRRRLEREPLQYLVGTQEFWSLDFQVTPAVLIPRPETEGLVELAIKLGTRDWGLGTGGSTPETRHPTPGTRSLTPDTRHPAPIRICDVGTGSGCIAVALAVELAHADIVAVDLSEAALRVAVANARRHAVDGHIRFVRGDLLDAVAGSFDVIVSNPPYVATDERPRLQAELSHEPATALFAGADGLEVIRRLIPQAAAKLVPAGVLLVEIGATQAAAVTELAVSAGYSDVTIEKDLAGLARVLVARK